MLNVNQRMPLNLGAEYVSIWTVSYLRTGVYFSKSTRINSCKIVKRRKHIHESQNKSCIKSFAIVSCTTIWISWTCVNVCQRIEKAKSARLQAENDHFCSAFVFLFFFIIDAIFKPWYICLLLHFFRYFCCKILLQLFTSRFAHLLLVIKRI